MNGLGLVMMIDTLDANADLTCLYSGWEFDQYICSSVLTE